MPSNSELIGWVYVLVNAAYVGLVKIGMTEEAPEQRAKDIRKEGVPYPFIMVSARFVSNRYAAEKAVHDLLSAHRETDDREFFRVDVEQAIKAVNSVAALFPPTRPPAYPSPTPEFGGAKNGVKVAWIGPVENRTARVPEGIVQLPVTSQEPDAFDVSGARYWRYRAGVYRVLDGECSDVDARILVAHFGELREKELSDRKTDQAERLRVLSEEAAALRREREEREARAAQAEAAAERRREKAEEASARVWERQARVSMARARVQDRFGATPVKGASVKVGFVDPSEELRHPLMICSYEDADTAWSHFNSAEATGGRYVELIIYFQDGRSHRERKE